MGTQCVAKFSLHDFACHSEMVYPTPSQRTLSTDDPRLRTGKYEPLVHMNEVVSEEIRGVMERLVAAAPPVVATSSLLSGALSKCLCCILLLRGGCPSHLTHFW